MKLTETQTACLIALHNRSTSFDAYDIGRLMRPKIAKIAAISVLRSLERKNLVYRIPPKDQWGTAFWGLNKQGEALTETLVCEKISS